MLKKLLLLAFTLTNGTLLIFMLCLGSQNLTKRHQVNLGFARTAAYPTGFVVGVAIAIGLVSGGCTTTVLLPSKKDDPFN